MVRRSVTLALLLSLLLAAFPAPAQTRKRAAGKKAPSAPTASAGTPAASAPILERNIRAELTFLASDAMQGRGSGTNYERVAAEYIGSQFRQFGLAGGGDADASGNKSFVQRVTVETAKFTGSTWNAVGVLRGSDPNGETIMLSAHLDHLGVNEALNGDKIFNGA